ncbi:DNA-binding protein [Salmonella enterica]|nr:DNA-binding protein [Salmonella enterica]
MAMNIKTLRLPEWLDKAMKELAKQGDRSFSKEAMIAMREYAERKGFKCPE